MMEALKKKIMPYWQSMQKREQRLVLGAAVLVVLALIWWLAISPALQALRKFDTDYLALEQQIERMQGLRQQALALREQSQSSSINPASAQRNLQNATTNILGSSGNIQTVGDRATVRLQNATAANTAQWLKQVRETARALPVQVDITSSGASSSPTWNGTITLRLPSN